MTDLYDRLFPTDPSAENIAVHAFHAAIVDYIAGETTEAQIIGAWSLDADAQADLDTLLTAVDALTGLDEKLRFVTEFDAVMKLASADLKYNTKGAFAMRLNL